MMKSTRGNLPDRIQTVLIADNHNGPDGNDTYNDCNGYDTYDTYDSYDGYDGYRMMKSTRWNKKKIQRPS